MARVDVIMPQMGESIAEGTLSRWLKKVGDEVKRDEPIFEISTDKVDAEIPAPSAGILAEILVTEGQTVPVQTVVARLETEKGAATGAATAPAPAAGTDDGNSRAKAPAAAGGPPPKTTLRPNPPPTDPRTRLSQVALVRAALVGPRRVLLDDRDDLLRIVGEAEHRDVGLRDGARRQLDRPHPVK